MPQKTIMELKGNSSTILILGGIEVYDEKELLELYDVFEKNNSVKQVSVNPAFLRNITSTKGIENPSNIVNQYLRICLRKPGLETLSLSGLFIINWDRNSSIVERGVNAIIQGLELNQTLNNLSLDNNKLSESDCAALTEVIIKHPKLVSVNLKGNHFTAEQLQKINEHMDENASKIEVMDTESEPEAEEGPATQMEGVESHVAVEGSVTK